MGRMRAAAPQRRPLYMYTLPLVLCAAAPARADRRTGHSVALAAPTAAGAPEQVHLSLTGAGGEAVVSWVTLAETAANTVRVGAADADGECSPSQSGEVAASADAFDNGGCGRTTYLHSAVLRGLTPGARYCYSVGGTPAAPAGPFSVLADGEACKDYYTTSMDLPGHPANHCLPLNRAACEARCEGLANCTYFQSPADEGLSGDCNCYLFTAGACQPYAKSYYNIWQRTAGTPSPRRVESAQHVFTAFDARGARPATLLAFGDVGVNSIGDIPAVTKRAGAVHPDAVLLPGDIAYNMDSGCGTTGDAFMREAEAFAAATPLLVAPGNHERAYNYTHYRNRFRMPTAGASGTNLYWSMDVSYAHIVFIDTELYYNDGGYPLTDPEPDYDGRGSAGGKYLRRMWEWLGRDLDHANANRAERPWILVFGHKPMYCSEIANSPDCSEGVYGYQPGVLRDGWPTSTGPFSVLADGEACKDYYTTSMDLPGHPAKYANDHCLPLNRTACEARCEGLANCTFFQSPADEGLSGDCNCYLFAAGACKPYAKSYYNIWQRSTGPSPRPTYGLEELLHAKGVDAYITAHVHAYERMWPTHKSKVLARNYTDPPTLVHLMSGAGGVRDDMDRWTKQAPWSAKQVDGTDAPGFAVLQIGETALQWSQVNAETGEPIDNITIAQSHHGPRA